MTKMLPLQKYDRKLVYSKLSITNIFIVFASFLCNISVNWLQHCITYRVKIPLALQNCCYMRWFWKILCYFTFDFKHKIMFCRCMSFIFKRFAIFV